MFAASQPNSHSRRQPTRARIETVGVSITTKEPWKADLIQAVRELISQGTDGLQLLFPFIADEVEPEIDLKIPRAMLEHVRAMIARFLEERGIHNYEVISGPGIRVKKQISTPHPTPAARPSDSDEDGPIGAWQDIGYL